MPAIITQQPIANQLTSAYKPIVISCTATTSTGGVPTLVFCDVYINSVYYRTFFSSKADKEGKYIFDIQDVIQENLNYFIPPIDGKKIEITTQTLVDVYVKIRTSKLNESGLNESEQTAPIPGSQETPPIAGEGISSNKFFALNLLIQHEENQDLPSLLKSYQTNQWNNEALPLTRRNQTNFLTNTQSSFFPFISEKRPKTICIDVRLKGQSSFSHYCKALTNDDINEVSNPPTINLKWMNATSSIEDVVDKTWDLKSGPFPLIKIKIYADDLDFDVVSVELFQKIGNDPFTSLGYITSSTYDVIALLVGIYIFKAKITDSKGNSIESNILKYQVTDTTGVININDGAVLDVGGGIYTYGGHGQATSLDLTISVSSVISTFYSSMDLSKLKIKFSNLADFQSWGYSGFLVNQDNYETTEISPSQLTTFKAFKSEADEPSGYVSVMHEFQIYHIDEPGNIFTNYLFMTFEN